MWIEEAPEAEEVPGAEDAEQRNAATLETLVSVGLLNIGFLK